MTNDPLRRKLRIDRIPQLPLKPLALSFYFFVEKFRLYRIPSSFDVGIVYENVRGVDNEFYRIGETFSFSRRRSLSDLSRWRLAWEFSDIINNINNNNNNNNIYSID